MSKNKEELKRLFKDFKVKEEFSSDTMRILEWKNKNGSGDFRMKFVIDKGNLFITGDLGTNAFSWGDRGNNGRLDIEWLSTLNPCYFFEKRVAKDINENLWDNTHCKDTAIASIHERIKEDELDPTLVAEFLEDIDYEEFNSEEEWISWLHENSYGEMRGTKYFGPDYAEFIMNAGIVEDYFRHDAIFVALEMISDQMKETQKIEAGQGVEFDEYTFTVSEHWLTVLFNGDVSGLEDGEEEQINEWLKTVPEKGHWAVPEEGEEASFLKDEISNLMSNCYELSYMVPKPKKEISIQSTLTKKNNEEELVKMKK